MIFYRRNIYGKLIFLRLLSLVTGILCYTSFDAGHTNLGYFLAVVLAFLSIIVIEDLIVFSDSFQVKKFYFLGILPIRRSFNKNEKIVFHSYASGFEEEEDEGEGFSHVETAAGCLFYLYSFFGKKNKVTHRKYTIKKVGGKSGFTGMVEIFLSRQEYELIKEIIGNNI
jgi:hypothetical protein